MKKTKQKKNFKEFCKMLKDTPIFIPILITIGVCVDIVLITVFFMGGFDKKSNIPMIAFREEKNNLNMLAEIEFH